MFYLLFISVLENTACLFLYTPYTLMFLDQDENTSLSTPVLILLKHFKSYIHKIPTSFLLPMT